MRIVDIGSCMSETERRRKVRHRGLSVHHTGSLFHPHGQRMMNRPEEKDGVLEALFRVYGVPR